MEFAELFTMLGLDTGTVVSVATVVFGAVALLRSELPGDLMKGWKSKAVGGAMALLLAWKAVPIEAGIATMILTGVAAWVGGEEVAAAMVESSFQAGFYLLDVTPPAGETYAGQIVTFTVDGVATEVSASWETRVSQELNLTAV